MRDARGAVRASSRSGTPAEERAIREINTGFIAMARAALTAWVESSTPDNAQGEYYITDIIAAVGAERARRRVRPRRRGRRRGINDRASSRPSSAVLMQARRGAAMRASRSSIRRASTFAATSMRADVRIDVGCVFEGDVTLADGVRIGPYCMLRDVSVGAGTRIEPFSYLVEATVGAAAASGRTRASVRERSSTTRCTSATSSR